MGRKYHMTQEENIFLAKRNIVDYIWKSANLEGIGVTYPDTQAIYNGMSVAGYKIEDINAINDLKHAWQHVIEHINDDLDLNYIQTVHRLLGKYTVINAGALRRHDVHIGGTEWTPVIPAEEDVKANISAILSCQTTPLEKALDIMLYLMRSQLFYDGNKRVAMLIGNKIMIEHGQGIISVKQLDIKQFYELLVKYYETAVGDELKEFIYNNCIDGMDFS